MNRAVDIISKAVDSSLDREIVRRLTVEPGVDSEGDDALDVTVVLGNERLSGAEAGRILLAVQTALAADGDDRFPVVTFTTEDELASDGGPEP